MFLAAIARTRFDDDGQCVFDRNIGFWPYIEMFTANENSRNRPAGTIEPKSFPSIETFTVSSLR